MCYAHTIFVKFHILLFFFFQKARSSLSFNYGVSKDSSAAFMLVNFILPLIAPYSPDFLIPQNLLSWNLTLLYSRIVWNLHLIIPKMSHLWTWKPFCLPNCCLQITMFYFFFHPTAKRYLYYFSLQQFLLLWILSRISKDNQNSNISLNQNLLFMTKMTIILCLPFISWSSQYLC